MKTIIRRSPRPWRGGIMAALVLVLAVAVAVVGVLTLAWRRGGPQPVREVAIDLNNMRLAAQTPAGKPQ